MRIQKAWVTIAAVEFDRSVQFYRHLFQQEPSLLTPAKYAEFEAFGIRLGIYRPTTEESPEKAPITLFPAVSLCVQIENLESTIAHLDQVDAFVGEVRSVSHGREAYAYDPDGNRIILYEPC
ncbi:VOC family protein [Leptolyngbya sp. FACHB-17]|uniref:VOC family protein n=1 Tax=unclassified Leptolyngbya TaxID=2650499 RepID=UPI0016800B9A|nr:VOC family protein [Leptolyngbya sp. FACHB-17]MBD2080309.1 VOC family protein [Leptolyngbya sp. FACHB-17]